MLPYEVSLLLSAVWGGLTGIVLLLGGDPPMELLWLADALCVVWALGEAFATWERRVEADPALATRHRLVAFSHRNLGCRLVNW